jgi:hypothetical protein
MQVMNGNVSPSNNQHMLNAYNPGVANTSPRTITWIGSLPYDLGPDMIQKFGYKACPRR